MKGKTVNVLLYISAFLPMLAVMWLKELITLTVNAIDNYKAKMAANPTINVKFDWSVFANVFLIVEIVFIVIVTVALVCLMHGNKNSAVKMVKIKNVKNQVAEYYLAYYSLFVLALIGFSLVNIADIISLCLLMAVLGIVYIRNGMFYMNPTVNILKSFIYEIEYEKNDKSYNRVVISKEKIHDGDTIRIYQSKCDFTLLEKKVTHDG